MRALCLMLLLCLAASVSAQSPLELVNERMEAHNRHELERFLATYDEDIKIYDYPNTPIGQGGKQHLRKIFTPLFETKSVHTTIHSQIVNGDYVVNRETVLRQNKRSEYISIYETKNGLITSVRFIKQ